MNFHAVYSALQLYQTFKRLQLLLKPRWHILWYTFL